MDIGKDASDIVQVFLSPCLLIVNSSTTFHQRAYAERITKIQNSAKVLDRLSRGVKKKKNPFFARSTDKEKKAPDVNFSPKIKDIRNGLLDISKALTAVVFSY